MKNCKVFLGMSAKVTVVAVLALGMALIGCDLGNGNGNGNGNGGTGDEITSDPPKSNLYSVAGAVETLENAGTLASNLDWLEDNAVNNGIYIIKLSASGSIGDIQLAEYRLHNSSDVSITLTTVGTAEVIVALNADGRLFTVGEWGGGDNITLTLGGSITLRGRSSNITELVRVNKDAKLYLTENAQITGNNAGGGVQAENGGRITMSGGKISGNNGGGVRLRNPGTTFTMSGGEISGNIAGDGGGVNMEDGAAFTMSGTAVIRANTSSWGGGGVRVRNPGTIFTMSGGEISGNTVGDGGGGGVDMEDGAAFTMSGTAVISNNTASQGGGVGMWGFGSSFTMTGGTISGNTADNDHGFCGAGLFVDGKPSYGGTFSKTGGIIYGDSDNIHTPGSTENTATYNGGEGHAVWLYTLDGIHPNMLRNSTSGETDNMSWDYTTPVGFDSSTWSG
jgi:hypothetical protein